MTSAEIRARSSVDLKEELSAKEREISNLRFRAGSEKASDPMRIRAIRREIARIHTVLRERELDLRGQARDAVGGATRAGKAAK